VVGSCEYGNEFSGSIKGGEFLYWQQTDESTGVSNGADRF
jgi:hypothetical protein